MNLKNALSDYIYNGGIFTRLSQLYNLPFINYINDIKTIDYDFMSRFGRREISYLVEDLITNSPYRLDLVVDSNNDIVKTTSNLKVYVYSQEMTLIDALCKILWNNYSNQWTKLWETMIVTYNPIHNYDMSETEKSQTNITTSNSNSTFGFNSTEATPTDNATSTTTGDLDENVRTLERKGNIGVTTSQKMLRDERDVWLYEYFTTIFKQAADLLTCKMYFKC